jgi:hypothetical protein
LTASFSHSTACWRIGGIQRRLPIQELLVFRVRLAQVLEHFEGRERRDHLRPEFVPDLRLEQRRDILARVLAHREGAVDQQLRAFVGLLARVALQEFARKIGRRRDPDREQDAQNEVELQKQLHTDGPSPPADAVLGGLRGSFHAASRVRTHSGPPN